MIGQKHFVIILTPVLQLCLASICFSSFLDECDEVFGLSCGKTYCRHSPEKR
eukprot:TRINITY_DN14520_c0_g1_i1.p1 TRINITY_DN14520_c0_g1~~TRINITY_DN14520_c0_g1_i1.p1  ORF type:complete len:52 (-),score=5.38 TRINITY_DN14520_c0_g1_i1:115-270(-)